MMRETLFPMLRYLIEQGESQMSQEGSFSLTTTSDGSAFFDSGGAGGVTTLYVSADCAWLLKIDGMHSGFVPIPANVAMPFTKPGSGIKKAYAKVASGTGTLSFGPLKP